jgi:hypothetical protein
MGTPGTVADNSGMSSATKNFFISRGLTDITNGAFSFFMEQISGIPMYVPQDERNSESPWYLDKAEMSYYNPEFIRWAGNTLLPEPGDGVFGFTFQQFYNHCYKRLFRVLAETYLYIENTLDIEEEVTLFVEKIKKEGTPTYYLDQRFSDLELETDYEVISNYSPGPEQGGMYEGYYDEYYGYYEEEQYEYSDGYEGYDNPDGFYNPYDMFAIEPAYILTPPKAVGFWFRRYIDETDDEVWEVLTNLFSKYDFQWYTMIAR